MARRLGPRFGLEAAFLVAAAVVAGVLDLTWPAIIAVMFIAWLLVAGVEVAIARRRTAPAPEPVMVWAPFDEPEPEAVDVVAPAELAPAAQPPVEPAVEEEEEPDRVAEAEQEPEPEPEEEPEPEPEKEPEPEPELEPAAEEEADEAPAAEGPPRRPELAAVPPPEPEPEVQVQPEPEPEPEPERVVVELRPAAPRSWNLWELERLVRETAGGDPERDEERAYLLMYLREFATPEGTLPLDFDGLVRETFPDLTGSGSAR